MTTVINFGVKDIQTFTHNGCVRVMSEDGSMILEFHESAAKELYNDLGDRLKELENPEIQSNFENKNDGESEDDK